MLPNDVCRCVPSHVCPLKDACRRFTEPGRVMADFSEWPATNGGECPMIIPVEHCSHPGCGTPTQPGPCAFDACPRKA